jgi:hypothetical protein
MKALQQIIQRVAENPAQPWALATLVQTEGSTYQPPRWSKDFYHSDA